MITITMFVVIGFYVSHDLFVTLENTPWCLARVLEDPTLKGLDIKVAVDRQTCPTVWKQPLDLGSNEALRPKAVSVSTTSQKVRSSL